MLKLLLLLLLTLASGSVSYGQVVNPYVSPYIQGYGPTPQAPRPVPPYLVYRVPAPGLFSRVLHRYTYFVVPTQPVPR